jgi:hypothetical protein
VLTKVNATDYNTQWSAPSGGVSAAYVDAADALRVLKAGDTMTGNLTVSGAWPGVNLVKPVAGSAAQLASYNGANLRWVMALGDQAAESGANAGSGFALARYSDAGAYLGTPMTINRATGGATFSATVAAPGFAFAGGGSVYSSGIYTVITNVPGNQCFVSGGTGDPSNYYRNTAHSFQDISGGTTFAKSSAGGFEFNTIQYHHYTSPGAGGWYDTSGMSQRFFVGTEGANDHFRIFGGGAGVNLLTITAADTTAKGNLVAGSEVKVRGNVIRFGDDNTFMYFNGSQFQFSHALSATVSGYLPIGGGTITGNFGVNGTSYVQEIQLAQSGSGAGMWFAVPGYGNRFYLGTEGSGDAFRLYTAGYGNALFINGAGDVSAKNISSNTHILSTNGYRCRPGQSDPGYTFSIDWPGGWFYIGGTAVGQLAFQSDYRIKKDIAPLKSMWDQVRKLNPISYTPKEYTPPGLEATAKSEGKPFVVETNIEHWGFIAHELQETLLPTTANGRKDDPDVVQSLAWPPLVAALTKALQEAMTRIEALEAKVAA